MENFQEKLKTDIDELLMKTPLIDIDIRPLIKKYTEGIADEHEKRSVRYSISLFLTNYEQSGLIVVNESVYTLGFIHEPTDLKSPICIKSTPNYIALLKPNIIDKSVHNTTHGNNSPIVGRDLKIENQSSLSGDLNEPINTPISIQNSMNKNDESSSNKLWELISNNKLLSTLIAAAIIWLFGYILKNCFHLDINN